MEEIDYLYLYLYESQHHCYVDPGAPIENSDETYLEDYDVFLWRPSNTRIFIEEKFFSTLNFLFWS